MRWAAALLFASACREPVAPRLSAIQERIFTPGCTFSSCHSAQGHAGELVLEPGRSFAQLVGRDAAQETAAREGLRRVVAGDPGASFLVIKLRPGLPARYGKRMPDTAGPLDDDDRAAIEEWIRRGAPDD